MKLVTFWENGREWVGVSQPTDPASIEDFLSSLQGEQLNLFERVCANLPCAKSYAYQYAHEYGWPEYILNQARVYTPARLSQPVPFYPKRWCCFENSYAYAKQHGYRYIEGIAIYPSGVQIHAWVSTDGTDVLDYTWPFQHVNKYFGIDLDMEWLAAKGYPQGGLLGHHYQRTQEKRNRTA